MPKVIEPPKARPTYEETYADYLRIFREVHEAPNGESSAPWLSHDHVWMPLLWYLGLGTDERAFWTRASVESACTQHPAMVDALWRADMRDKGTTRHLWEDQFPMTTYSSFYRPEILAFMRSVLAHPQVNRRRTLLLLPCTADKPYPARLHKLVGAVVPEHIDIAAVSTAVGVAPKHLWSVMPRYDNGLPLFDRIAEALPPFFARTSYSEVINYTDMLQHDIENAVRQSVNDKGQRITVVTPVPFPRRCDYSDLTNNDFLLRLRSCCFP